MNKTARSLAAVGALMAGAMLFAHGQAQAEESFVYRITSSYHWGSGTLSGWFRAAYDAVRSNWFFKDFRLQESAGIMQGYVPPAMTELRAIDVPAQTYTSSQPWFGDSPREMSVPFARPGEVGGFSLTHVQGEESPIERLGDRTLSFEALSSHSLLNSAGNPTIAFSRGGLGFASLLKICH